MFEYSAGRHPNRVALATAEGTVTYGELDAMADIMAMRMIAAGAQPGDRIAVLCDRRPHLIAVLLGVLKSGGAYVPLDTDSPQARQESMLRVAGAKLLVSDSTFATVRRAGFRVRNASHRFAPITSGSQCHRHRATPSISTTGLYPLTSARPARRRRWQSPLRVNLIDGSTAPRHRS